MRSLYLPLIIFWKAATGQPQGSADFGFAIWSPPNALEAVRIRAGTDKSILSFLSILALPLPGAPDDPMQPNEGAFNEALHDQISVRQWHARGMAPGNRPLHCRARQWPRAEGENHLPLHEKSRRFQLLASCLGRRRFGGQDAAAAGLLQALYREDPAGGRRRSHGHADRIDRRNFSVNERGHVAYR